MRAEAVKETQDFRRARDAGCRVLNAAPVGTGVLENGDPRPDIYSVYGGLTGFRSGEPRDRPTA